MKKPHFRASISPEATKLDSVSVSVLRVRAISIKNTENRPIPITVMNELNAQANDASAIKSGSRFPTTAKNKNEAVISPSLDSIKGTASCAIFMKFLLR